MKEGVTIRVYVSVTLLAVLLALLSCSEPEDEKTDALKSSPARTNPETPSPILTPLVPTATSISPTVKPKPDLVLKAFPTHDEPLPSHWGLWDYIGVNLIVEDGCLRARGFPDSHGRPSISYLLIWPDGFNLKYRDGFANISDQNDEIVAKLGDAVRLSGRLVKSDSDLGHEIAESISEKCKRPYYLVGDDVSVLEIQEQDIVSADNSTLMLHRQKMPRSTTGLYEDTLDTFIGPFELVQNDDCLLIEVNPAERHALLWLPGFYPHIGEDGNAEIRNGGDRVIARIGDEILVRTKEREISESQMGTYLSECDAWLWHMKEVRNNEFPVVFSQYYEERLGYDYIRGNLQIHNGCMYIGRRIMIFPPDFIMHEEKSSIYIMDENGVVVAREGENAELRGRRVSQDDDLGRQIRRTLPIDCPHADFWFVN